jgi:clan AA aspartic protease
VGDLTTFEQLRNSAACIDIALDNPSGIKLLAYFCKNENMGLTYTTIKMSNPRKPALEPIEVKCLADTGALMMSITETMCIQLQLEELEKRAVTIADGSIHQLPFVGPVRIDFGNRFCFTGAFVFGNEALLGAVPMEEMDLVVHPAKQKVMPNPEHPNVPQYIMY